MLFTSLAYAQGAPAAQPAAPSFSFFIPLSLVFIIFYFLMIRPQQKQQKERQKALTELKKGDEVVTTAGLHGKIVGIADNVLTIAVGENESLKLKFDREAVARVKKGE